MLELKNQIRHWVKERLRPESLFHGLKWMKTGSGQVRVQVAPQWLGMTPSSHTGALVLASEMAIEEAFRLEERMSGISVLFMGSQSEFLKANRGPCEIRFRMEPDDMERLRLQVLKEKTLRHEFFLTLWNSDDAQLGTVTLQVSLQLQPYLSASNKLES
ncbi:hypothetical protein GW916_07725 [bacterium]|nr:hypothetical protein [bacterium]